MTTDKNFCIPNINSEIKELQKNTVCNIMSIN